MSIVRDSFLGSRVLTMHVSIPLHKRRYVGCSTWRNLFIDFFIFDKMFSCWMTLGEGTQNSPTSNSSLFSRLSFWLRLLFFPSLSFFICNWSSSTYNGVKGWSSNFFSMWVKVISLVRPLCMVFFSNCQRLPNKMWQASIGIISQSTLSSYFPTENLINSLSPRIYEKMISPLNVA